MLAEIPPSTPEVHKSVGDNDRKFVVESLDPKQLAEEVVSYTLTTDWLVTEEASETKLAKKAYDNGDSEYLYIEKVDVDGDRKAKKKIITENEYNRLLASSILTVEKHRSEFTLTQGSIKYTAKYDEFRDSSLRILEIDAESKKEEERKAFNLVSFPYALVEVTGFQQFYGHRVATVLHDPSE